MYILKPPYSMVEGDVLCVVDYTKLLLNLNAIQNSIHNSTQNGIKHKDVSITIDREVDRQLRECLEAGCDIYNNKQSHQGSKKKGKKLNNNSTCGSGSKAGKAYNNSLNKKIVNRPEIALKIGGDYDFSSDEENEEDE